MENEYVRTTVSDGGVSVQEYERLLRLLEPMDRDSDEAKAINGQLDVLGHKLTQEEVDHVYGIYFAIRRPS